MSEHAFMEFANELILEGEDFRLAMEKKGTVAQRNHEQRVLEMFELFKIGDGNRGETRWDALNAITQWLDHKRRAYAPDDVGQRTKRLAFSWFGNGVDLKQRAVEMLVRQ
jgi:hypothetical protein